MDGEDVRMSWFGFPGGWFALVFRNLLGSLLRKCNGNIWNIFEPKPFQKGATKPRHLCLAVSPRVFNLACHPLSKPPFGRVQLIIIALLVR